MGAGLWLLFTFIVGCAARSRGRSFFLWFVLALVLSPLLAVIWLLLLSNRVRVLPDVLGRRRTYSPYAVLFVAVAALAILHLALR